MLSPVQFTSLNSWGYIKSRYQFPLSFRQLIECIFKLGPSTILLLDEFRSKVGVRDISLVVKIIGRYAAAEGHVWVCGHIVAGAC